MAGPWEKYAAPAETAPADVPPWAKYAAPATTPPIDAAQIAETINRQFAPAAVPQPQIAQPSAMNTGLLQGMTLGFGDELMAGALSPIEAIKGAVTGEDADKGFGQRMSDAYGRALDRERGVLHKAEAEHPIATTAGNLAGGLMLGGKAQEAGLTLLKGAPSIWRGAAEGAGYGALQGFGSGEGGFDQRALGAAQGGAFGGGVGAGVGAVSKAIPVIANYVNAFRDPEIGSLSKPALDYARRNISPDLLQSAQDLGPLGTLADVSPEWLGVARGSASVPDSRGIVVDALLQRGAGANQRLAGDLDAALGPRVIPSQVEAGLKSQRQALGPVYEKAFDSAKAVDTAPLAQKLDAAIVDLRGDARAAATQVRGMLNVHGTDALDPNPRSLFETRKAIDGLLNSAQDGNVRRVLSEARKSVDDALTASVPGIKAADAAYADLMSQSNALERGQQVLGNGPSAIRPEELAGEQSKFAVGGNGPSLAPQRLAEGARAEIDRVVGTNANDPGAWNRLMRGDGDWNREKLGTLFGRDNADAALAAGDREAIFNATRNRVENGSDTGMTQGFREAMKGLEKPADLPPNVTTLGLLGWAGKKGLDTLRSRSGEKAASDFASQLGRLSVAQGDARDRVVEALIKYQAGKKNPQLSPGMQAIVSALIQRGGIEGRAIAPTGSR